MEFNIVAFREKKEAHFNILFRKYYAAIVRYTNQTLGGEEDTEDTAEDVASECFVKVWEKAETFETEEHIKRFLYVKAKNDCLNIIESKKRRDKKIGDIAYQTETVEELKTDFDKDIVSVEIIRSVQFALSRMSSIVRKVVTLHLEGKTTDEIAQVTGTTNKTVLNQKLSGLNLIKLIAEKRTWPIIDKVLIDPQGPFEIHNIRDEYILKRDTKSGRKSNKFRYVTYEVCAIYLSRIGVRSSKDFVKLCKDKKRPSFIPSTPCEIYENWPSYDWEIFLGQYNHKHNYMSYKQTKEFVHKIAIANNLNSGAKFQAYRNENPHVFPKDMHVDVYGVFHRRGEWVSWDDFLGVVSEGRTHRGLWGYERCKIWVRENFTPKGINNVRRYLLNADKLPVDIPRSDPRAFFQKRGEWISDADFFGVPEGFLSFAEAAKVVSMWGLKNPKEFDIYKNQLGDKFPLDIPKNPVVHFWKRKEWEGWAKFLGTKDGKIARWKG